MIADSIARAFKARRPGSWWMANFQARMGPQGRAL